MDRAVRDMGDDMLWVVMVRYLNNNQSLSKFSDRECARIAGISHNAWREAVAMTLAWVASRWADRRIAA